METMKSRKHVRALTEASVLVAIGFVLSFFKVSPFLYGGSITPASMLFILVIGIRRGPMWGIGGALVYSCLQMLQGIHPPPVQSMPNFVLVVLLDYVVAFTVLGFAGFFGKMKKNILFAAPVCLSLRFLCHFISGIIIWGAYVPVLRDENNVKILDEYGNTIPIMSVEWYSFIYNGTYIGAELVICMAAAIAIMRYDKRIFIRQE